MQVKEDDDDDDGEEEVEQLNWLLDGSALAIPIRVGSKAVAVLVLDDGRKGESC